MRRLPHGLLGLVATALLSISATGCISGGGSGQTVVLYGFSAMEEVMKQEIVPAFQRHWKERTGEDVQVISAFAGSETITNQIIFGAPAQVAMVATEMDAISIKEAGHVTTDWRSFKNHGSYAYSVACIVTRNGNPFEIDSFDSLPQRDVEVVYPDPTTSGGAQWAILALYGSALKASEAVTGQPDSALATALLRGVSLRAGSLPESARRALTQFALGYGDVLLTYENEALLDRSKGRDYEIVVPNSTIYIEPKVILIDQNISDGQREVVRALVDFLWTPEAQEALARNHFRVWDEAIMSRHANKYQKVSHPFTVEYLGGWEKATLRIIEQSWRRIQREIN